MNILKYQTLCDLALEGAAVRWQNTPIQETDAARATDPFRFEGRLADNWWRRAEPRDEQGREIIRLVERGKLRDQMVTSKASRHEHERAMTMQRTDDEFEPNETESVSEWLARVATIAGPAGPNKILWDGMRVYAGRFSGAAPARKTLDAKLVRGFLKNVKRKR